MPRVPLRWVAISIFLFASMLNYLDRSLMAALAPTLKTTFHLDNAQYGWILSAFSLAYAFTAPLAGVLIDKVGLNLGAMIAVTAFSLTGAATGLATSFRALLGIRTAFGVSAAAGLPLFGKANAMYLEPSERAFGTAMNQIGISLGAALAPLIVAALTARSYGWQTSFFVCGALGFVWVPLWWFVAKKAPPKEMEPAEAGAASLKELLRDKRVWGLAFGTLFIMSLYSLWTNWTTLYFVEVWKMTTEQANRDFAWIPPVAGTVGGFFGGWLAYRAIRVGTEVVAARLRVSWLCAGFALITAVIPLMPNRGLAAIAVSVSYFWTVCISTNLYALPIDLFGPRRAAFGVAVLTFAYGLFQFFVSPVIGTMVDHGRFTAVCIVMSMLPLVGVGILQVTTREKS
ncbi:MAG TPA: MFS transporter [Bryobacteraceae bacterium]|jgi:ACS family hexuronate transporter-like MFS transporter|nr:MFS transporter [Bryobacteraceae bacterium]